jgi:hypothetical protein
VNTSPRESQVDSLAPSLAASRAALRRPALYPQLYLAYVFASSLDVLFTWLIIWAGGREENWLADWIIRQHDLYGLVVFKFLVVMLVVGICEFVGRRRFQTGATLARWAVVLSTFPVVVGATHLLRLAAEQYGWE